METNNVLIDEEKMEQNLSNEFSQKAVKVEELPAIKEKSKAYYFFKRVFDFFVSLIAIIIISIPMLIIGLIVKCTSKGPMIFKDIRIGMNGKEIKVWKFRSMYIDAEIRLKDYLTDVQYNQWVIERKIDNDPRITKIGGFIRKTSIDELPQLFNILKGDMSFVGPRAITKNELDEHYTDFEKKIILSAKPGLTGYWQCHGRSNVDFESGGRQKLELEYFSKRGFWYDIGLIIMTIPAVLKKKGAK